MKQGFRIIDTDTHVGPGLEVIEKYAGPALKRRWDELEPYTQPTSYGGHHLSIHPYRYKRMLNTTPDVEEGAGTGGASPLFAAVSKRSLKVPFTPGALDENSKGRLADMDTEGVDVHLIIPGTFSSAVSALDPDLTSEIHAAYNRYIAAYCDADPERLRATVLVSAHDPDAAAETIRKETEHPWVAAVTVVLKEGLPIDHPSLHPIWQALDECDMPLLQHSFFYEPPYFPGYRDLWGNVVVARSAAHPWLAQRLVAYMALSGLFDQYPRLRVGFSECSAGWLPAWLIRLQGQADYMAAAVPQTELTPLEYAQAGHIYCGIELYEGEKIARSIIDIVGDGVLMYQSDYPHPNGDYPDSPDTVLGWTGLGEDNLRKIMSENAERYLRM